MIVIAIIGLIAAIAIPNFVKARGTSQRNACIKNLQQIDGAKERWALEKRVKAGSDVVTSEVDAYIKGGAPECPGGGSYTYQKLDLPPLCDISGHSI